jgi:hypothetical protein
MVFKRISLPFLVIAQLIFFSTITAQSNGKSLAQLVQNTPARALPFTDSISSAESGTPIPLNEVRELGFLSIYELDTVYLLYKILVSDNFHTVVFGYDEGNAKRHVLITFAKDDYQPIYSIDIAEKHNAPDQQEIQTQIHPRGFSTITIHNKSRRSFKHFLFTHEGTFVTKQWKSWRTLIQEGSLVAVRSIKNRKGTYIKDVNGAIVDTFNYADDVYVVRYDSSKLGSQALIVRSFPLYQEELLVLHDSANFGYINVNDLYKGNGFNRYKSEYAEGEDDRQYLYYYTRWIALKPYQSVEDFDIRQMIEIERVDWNDYRNHIIVAEDSAINSFFFPYQDGQFTLSFTNGEQMHFKDSTYQMEYEPTMHFQLVENQKFREDYLIYNHFFEEYNFYLLNKQNGDTTGYFRGYPFVSPHRNYIVSFDTPYTYGQGEVAMEIQTLQGKRYRHELSALFDTWNVPRIKYIYWLSDTEFILKAKPVEDAYSKEEDTEYFYLKFTIKI